MSEGVLEQPLPGVRVLQLSMQEYQSLIDATATRTLTAEERGQLTALIETTAAVQLALEVKHQCGSSEALTKLLKLESATERLARAA